MQMTRLSATFNVGDMLSGTQSYVVNPHWLMAPITLSAPKSGNLVGKKWRKF